MKTKPFHAAQTTALELMDGKRWFALHMEQGTGKTWTFLADAERAFLRDKIDALFVFAPNGVHTNWVRREIPTHLEAEHEALYWKSGMGKVARRTFQRFIDNPRDPSGPLRIMAMAYEALSSEDAFKYALDFCMRHRTLMVLDESQYIKNHQASRTQQIMRLQAHTVARREGSGTPFDKPFDIFSQAQFLKDGLLGTSSYRAFCAEYAQLVDWKEPKCADDWAHAKRVEANPRIKHAIIVAKDDDTGLPIYRNLEKLRSLMKPWSYRVLKKDCLDLPPKVYQNIYFELEPKQRAAYDLLESELRIQLENGELEPVQALAAIVKLQQITSGYVVVPGREELLYVSEKNPRMEALATSIELSDRNKMIVWARFKEEIRTIVALGKKMGRNVVEYHGGIKEAARQDAIDEFQLRGADLFVANQQAGGTGLTLTAASRNTYASNYYSLLRRLQSEDRTHRIGTINAVSYDDLVALNTVDESIAKALQQKADLSATILGDRELRVPAGIQEENHDESLFGGEQTGN